MSGLVTEKGEKRKNSKQVCELQSTSGHSEGSHHTWPSFLSKCRVVVWISAQKRSLNLGCFGFRNWPHFLHWSSLDQKEHCNLTGPNWINMWDALLLCKTKSEYPLIYPTQIFYCTYPRIINTGRCSVTPPGPSHSSNHSLTPRCYIHGVFFIFIQPKPQV